MKLSGEKIFDLLLMAILAAVGSPLGGPAGYLSHFVFSPFHRSLLTFICGARR